MTSVFTAAAARRAVGNSVERLDSVDAAPAEWDELAVRCGNVFGTREFLSAWWDSFGAGRELHVHAVRDPDRVLLGLLPLYAWRARRVRVLRFLGHGAGDELGPIAEPPARQEVARALLDVLSDVRASLLVGEQLPADAAWSTLLGGRRISLEGSPVLRFGHGSWDEYVAAQSANLRQQIRRLERRLGKAHSIRFVCPTEREEFETGLDMLFALHRARWSGTETNFARREHFHRAFARTAHERGWARLWLLEVNRSPAAAWYGLRFAGSESYYQMGRDPRWDHASVGFVLLVHSIREALADGMEEYRFLRGGESYKYRFATGDQGLESMVYGRNAGGAAMLLAAHPAVALRRALRRRR
jgi:CelD/BcsL family acetyltransferase involved in cellulose biosynthesis